MSAENNGMSAENNGMSAENNGTPTPPEMVSSPPPARRRGMGGRLLRGVAWLIGGALLLLVVAVGGFWWYSTTPDFQHRLNEKVVEVLENATGGRVELQGLSFSLWHLAIEADGLVIHGLEGPGQAPYLSAEKIEVRVKILSFFAHTTGTGLASHIGLDLLRVEHPEFHLIVYKDGSTNQPVPKHPSTRKTPLQDTLLDLKANDMELVDGVALLNDRAIPFDVAARNVEAQVHYLSASDRYGFSVQLEDLQTKMKTQEVARSRLRFDGELGRNIAVLKNLEFDSGKSSELHATATLKDFSKPEWQAKIKGALELKQVSDLTGFEGLTGGVVDLALDGHSCEVTPAVAQRRPHFWQRRHAPTPANPAKAKLAPSPECEAGYLVVGSAKVYKAGYTNQYLVLHDVDGGAQLHITPSELLLTALTGHLPGGGDAAGELRIEDWLGETAATATTKKTVAAPGNGTNIKATASPVVRAHAYLVAKVNQIPLRTIMEIVEPHGYRDLGFDTAINGPVKVEWGGPAADIADTVQVDGDLTFRPTGVVRRGALDNVPVSGEAHAHYDGSREVVNIQSVTLTTPQSSVQASGVLGVNDGDPLTNLRAEMVVHDLGEYDQLLQTLGFSANGKKGVAAIPVTLHGGLVFQGSVTGRAADLDFKGHLQGTNIEVKLDNSFDTQIDSLVADAEYSFDSGLAIATSTIERGTAVLNVSGTLRPRREVSKRGTATYVWDGGTSVDADVKLTNAQLTDVLQMVGQQQIPVTGEIATTAHVAGTLDDLNGEGEISLKKGVAYGESYESAVANLQVHGQDFEASQVVLLLYGSRITGNAGYDLTSKHVHGHLEASNLLLSKFQAVNHLNPNVNAKLSAVVDADGTLDQPGLKVSAKLADVTLSGKPLGAVAIEAHSEGSTLLYTAQSTVIGAKVDATGQTQLSGDYSSQAKLTISDFNVGTAVAMFSNSGIKAQSSIGGVVNLRGPLKTPSALVGTAEFNQFDVKLQGVELKSAGPMRVGLRDGLATLDQIHITGEDTDLQLSGTLQAFGATGPAGGKIDLKGSGSVSVAIAHTFDPDILSSGKVEFSIAAGGEIRKPSLTGRVKFDNVNMAVQGIPNGLSALNGTLIFNQDRLQVENLTATTGGGQLKIGGFLTYSQGLYADLTATGNAVRVRLYGLSTTANINLKLQGGTQSMLLSGDVLITRFGVGPNVDFAAFSSVGSSLSMPPEPGAVSNKIQLNVRVTSSPQLDFQNSYAKLAGTVNLTVRGTVAEPAILGRIQITEGSATFAGTKYELQRGDIYFSNPVRIDPTIDVDATARVENYDITIGLQGTLSNLKPTYRSEPPLSESDIFALLALGRTQEEAQLYQEQQVQQGANPTTSALLGGALNATVSNRIGKLFGGGTVKIDPAFVGTLGNSSARITIQKQITRQLSVTYATNVNSTAEQLLQAQYDLTPNSSIVVTRDETGVFSVVYKIRRRYR